MTTWDLNSTRSLNLLNHRPAWSMFFGVISRLGDGVFWYVLGFSFPFFFGWEGVRVFVVMLIAGLSCTALYKSLKHLIARPRPCNVSNDLLVTTAPLDTWSFPSGHTLHAVCFTIIAVAFIPWLSYVLWPFTVLVGLSRMILGLHYPSDVIAGAVIGASVAIVATPFL